MTESTMGELRGVNVPLQARDGSSVGTLRISLLPTVAADSSPPPLLVRRHASAGSSIPAVQLLEGTEYRFEFVVNGDGALTTDHEDIFDADEANDGRKGRLRPQLNTGTVRARVSGSGALLGFVEFEVRSRKVDYLTDYQTMLGDLTSAFADAVMLRFAAGHHEFEPDDTRDARTLYQHFAFLQCVLGGGAVEDALRLIQQRPYLQWEHASTLRDPAHGVRPSSGLLRQLSSGRAKQPGSTGSLGSIATLPRRIEALDTTPSVDNLPNRFVRYALETWSAKVALLRDLLDRSAYPSNAVLRGRAETRELHAVIESWLQLAPFRDVGQLARLPRANQVLEKREGYRDVYRAFFQAQLAASLTWEGGEDVYGAGKRDVATLYEYWCYLQLAEVLSELCDEPLDFGQLVALGPNGITVTLRAGAAPALRGWVRRGRVGVRVSLWFNRTFKRGNARDLYRDVSWSRDMRPDCSLKFEIHDPEALDFELGSSWLHFDAKYRVDDLGNLFGGAGGTDPAKGATREDLLKMHAYRDAIRRSVGAYVLYPGDIDDENAVYDELLPGLGAFRLRPGETDVGGRAALKRFLEEALHHFTDPYTRQRRVRYWTMRTYGSERAVGGRPAADTPVLLAYTRSEAHRAWVTEMRCYNVRADLDRRGGIALGSTVLSAEFVLLHGPRETSPLELWSTTGSVEVATDDELRELGYPSPGGKKYFILRLGERRELPLGASSRRVAELRVTQFSPEVVGLVEIV